MTPSTQSPNLALTGEQRNALSSIELVVALCKSASPDAAVDYEIQELAALHAAVEHEWPLPPALKQKISIGPFAAKNIADWDAELANALMSLDYALQHDIGLIDIQWTRIRPVKENNERVQTRSFRSA
jgi:hypothetical protein